MLSISRFAAGAVDFTFPSSLYPSNLLLLQFRSKCPFQYDQISYCSSKFENCIAQQNSLDYCSREFCSCLEVRSILSLTSWQASLQNDEGSSEPRGDHECQEHSRNACLLVDRHGKSFEKQIIHKKKDPKLKWIKNRITTTNMLLDSAAEACMIKEELDKEADLLKERLNSSNEFVDLFAVSWAWVRLLELWLPEIPCPASSRKLNGSESDAVSVSYLEIRTGSGER